LFSICHRFAYEQATLLSQRKTDKEDIHKQINNQDILLNFTVP
jgi:hypothetical protein